MKAIFGTKINFQLTSQEIQTLSDKKINVIYNKDFYNDGYEYIVGIIEDVFTYKESDKEQKQRLAQS